MYSSLLLLITITTLYAAYNLLIKASTNLVPVTSTSTILATIALQISALAISSVFAIGLLLRGGQTLSLPLGAYVWAAAAGLCIGAAEIGYFYLFRGSFGSAPMPANLAIPSIVAGTIIIALLASWLFLREPISGMQLLGAALVVTGIVVMFTAENKSFT